MSSSFRIPILTLLFTGLLASWLKAASSEEDLAKAWESASTFRSNEAYVEFNKAAALKSGNPREIALGRATTLISIQPKTTGNVEEAADLCQKLIQENPGDEIGLLATYLLARIEQFERQPANLEKASEIYRGLIDQHPESLAAQISISKLAVLGLFRPGLTPQQKNKNLTDLETYLVKIKQPEARCNTFIVMGNACVMFQLGDEKALRYLMEAEACQISSVKLRGDVLIQIGGAAQRLKRKDIALLYYSKFVDDYKRDIRNYLVRQKMAELKSGS